MLQEVFFQTIKIGFETAVFLGVVFAVFRRRQSTPASFKWLWVSFGPLAVVFAYRVRPLLDDRSYELAISAGALAALLLIMLVTWLPMSAGGRAGAFCSRFEPVLPVLGAGAILGQAVSLALIPQGLTTPNGLLVSTDFIYSLLAFAGAVALVPALVAMIGSAAAKLRRKTAALWLSAAILPMLVAQLTTTIQMLAVTGRLDLPATYFAWLAILINSRETISSGVYLAVLFLAGAVLWRRRRPVPVSGNPAAARLEKAAAKRQIRLAALLVVTALGGSAVAGGRPAPAANQAVKLSPVKPVVVQGGAVKIPLKELRDGRLHRFAFERDGVKIRFIVAHKGSNVHGTAFDACDNCGTVGYYEKEKNIICRNCDAYINTATLGLPGGCNPIPLKAELSGLNLLIDETDLTDALGDWR